MENTFFLFSHLVVSNANMSRDRHLAVRFFKISISLSGRRKRLKLDLYYRDLRPKFF